MSVGHHEDFSRGAHGGGASDRNFGWVFTAAFLFFGLWPRVHGRPIRPALLALSALVLILTLLRPSLLHPANAVWTRIGQLLGKVMNPVITALLFFVVFTPPALILRWRKKDLLGLTRDPEAESYWITREPTAESDSMVNQF
jgi:hypothetical protein